MAIKKIHVYDIDGTLVSSLHRYRTQICADGIERIDLAHWREHDHAEYIMRDELLPLAEQYQADLADPETYVVLATARACVPGDANYQFIQTRLGLPNKFIHRQGPEDARGGAQIKIAGMLPLLNLKQFKGAAVHFWEDNRNYLDAVCSALGAIPHFVESGQGH